MPVISPPLPHTKFSLDASAVAGFIGGEESFSAMKSIPLMRGRRWVGWYNCAGSVVIARKCGTISDTHFWDWIFPGPTEKPAKTFELDNLNGPRFTGVYSGTQIPDSGHLAHLVAYHCKEHVVKKRIPGSPSDQDLLHGISVTVIKLNESNGFDIDITEENLLPFNFLAFVPILFTAFAAAFCALIGDWYCFTVITYGAVANGITTLVVGAGTLRLIGPKPSEKSPQGDGILFDTTAIIILQGSERLVSRIIRGRFDLYYANTSPAYHRIGLGSLMLLLHSVIQLILIPQGNLVGQILFLCTLGVSWSYVYMSAFDHKALQAKVLLQALGNPKIDKYHVDKWTNAAALAAAYTCPKDPLSILEELIPNRTATWDTWRAYVAGAIREGVDPSKYEPTEKELSIKNLQGEDAAFVRDFLGKADKAFEDAKRLAEVTAPDEDNHQPENKGSSSTFVEEV